MIAIEGYASVKRRSWKSEVKKMLVYKHRQTSIAIVAHIANLSAKNEHDGALYRHGGRRKLPVLSCFRSTAAAAAATSSGNNERAPFSPDGAQVGRLARRRRRQHDDNKKKR